MLPHEQTTPKARTDRLELTRATEANLSAVWGLSLAGGLSQLLDEPGEWLGELTDEGGVHHTFERVTDPVRVGAIEAAVGAAPVIIADGHHRYEVARTYRDERRAVTGGMAGPVGPHAGLHRRAGRGPARRSRPSTACCTACPPASTSRRRCGPSFEMGGPEPITPLVTRRLHDAGALCLVGPDGLGHLLRPRPSAFTNVRDLDSARLDKALGDVPCTITYQHGVDNVVSRRDRRPGRLRGAAAAGVDRADRGDGQRQHAHAAEVDVLRAQAEDRPRVALDAHRRGRRPSSSRLRTAVYSTCQVPLERSSAARSPGPLRSDAATSWRLTSVVYSGRSTSRNTPIGVGSWTRVRQPRQGEGQARIVTVDVVDEDGVLARRRPPARSRAARRCA